MQAPRSTRIGLLLIASSLVLTIFRFALAYVLDTFLTVGAADTFLGQSVRIVWIPAASDMLLVSTAAVGLLGFAFVWRGRGDLGAEYSSHVGLAILAALAAVIVLGLWTGASLLLGFVPGMSGLVPWRSLLALLGTVFVGLALYGVLANLPLSGVRPVSAVALALGMAGGAAVFAVTLQARRGRIAALDGAAIALSLVSVVLWLVLFLWGWRALGTGRVGPSAAAASSRGD